MRNSPRRHRLVSVALLALLVGLGGCGGSSRVDEAEWVAELTAYREDRLERLKQPHGWLSLVALHWLEEGKTSVGTDADNDLVLPSGSAAERVVELELVEGQVTLLPINGIEVTVDGERASDPTPLRDDSADDPSYVMLGRARMHILEREGLKAVRVTDPESPIRTGFSGLTYFDDDPSYVVDARFEPYEEPRTVEIPTVQGTVSQMLVPGVIEFRLLEQEFSLQVFVEELTDTELFVIFRDETSGQGSYGAGRYLYVERDGTDVVVDFNRAYNPPCTFTGFATCPLPPRQNWMKTPIEAGERDPKVK